MEKLFEKEDLNKNDTEPNTIWVETERGGYSEHTEGNRGICFADRIGANFYAFEHNKHGDQIIPVVIKVEVDIEDVVIDGADFLNTTFSFINRDDLQKAKKQKNLLSKLFGNKIGLYVDKILKHPKSDKYAVCTLAKNDDDIITSHYKNTILMKGRGGTTFRSSFHVKIPIPPTSIREIFINKPYETIFKETICLSEVAHIQTDTSKKGSI